MGQEGHCQKRSTFAPIGGQMPEGPCTEEVPTWMQNSGEQSGARVEVW